MPPDKTTEAKSAGRSNVELGAAFAFTLFLLTLVFDAGIQYGQIGTLSKGQTDHDTQIRAVQAAVAANAAVTGPALAHIETMVEDMRAAQELKATGASR